VEVALSTTGVDAQGRPQRVPLVTTDDGSPVAVEAPPMVEPDLAGEHMLINIGPQHPATHGVLRLVLELDGETVVRCIPHIGYLHCGFEKLGEYRQYNQILPLTDREDYLNAMGNNVGCVMSAERLFGIEITERCKVLRVIACELSRIASHLVWLGTTCIDIGAFTPFLWAFQQREYIYNLIEDWVGARLTPTITRVGGLAADIPDGWLEKLKNFSAKFPHTVYEIDQMLTKNGIWVGRTVGLGVMTPDEAINWGLSGPMLRASGVAYDVRKDFPYYDYETYDFDVPVGTNGDVYDRYLVRMEELRQSVRILEQAAKRLPDGPINVDDPRVILPPKSKATSEMESMIHHFKLVMEGPRPPLGEAYVAMESPKGEKGYYMVSDGTSKPVRWRIRPPSFVNLSAIPKMVEGHLLSDVIAINASIDIVMGEIDR
jgi:NADH-quinone oxidoreductase subunit D